MPDRAYFDRPELAEAIASDLVRPALYGSASPGLFLSAPRRTGKSTFLRRDLKPALERRGLQVLYVDLWADASQPPAELIASTVAQALAAAQGKVLKVALAAGMSKVSIKGVEFSLDKVGKAPGATIGDALAELHRITGARLAFIIDEAQHVVRVDPTMAVMRALKAARDALNSEEDTLFLVMSGSDRDKLLRLVNGNGAPFLGARIQRLPVLAADYVAYAAGRLVRAYPELDVDNARLAKVFTRYDARPEFFEEDTALALSPLAGPVSEFMVRLEALAARREAERDGDFADTFNALSPLQKAVLAELSSGEGPPKLFAKAALARYAKAARKKISPGQARAAIEQLRERDPPILWRSDRGDYAFEDTGFQRWYLAHVNAAPE